MVGQRAEERDAGRVFRTELSSRQRKAIEAACVDMWEPFRLSLEQWAPQCLIVYDKFHSMQHAGEWWTKCDERNSSGRGNRRTN